MNDLLSTKLNDVRNKSFDLTSINFAVQPFSVFKDYANKNLPVLLTIEVDIHLPLARDAVPASSSRRVQSAPAAARSENEFEDD